MERAGVQSTSYESRESETRLIIQILAQLLSVHADLFSAQTGYSIASIETF